MEEVKKVRFDSEGDKPEKKAGTGKGKRSTLFQA